MNDIDTVDYSLLIIIHHYYCIINYSFFALHLYLDDTIKSESVRGKRGEERIEGRIERGNNRDYDEIIIII